MRMIVSNVYIDFALPVIRLGYYRPPYLLFYSVPIFEVPLSFLDAS